MTNENTDYMIRNETTDYIIRRSPTKRIENNHRILCECQECLSNLWFSDIQSKNRFWEMSETTRLKMWVYLDKDQILPLWHVCKLPRHLEKPDDIAYRFADAISWALREVNYRALCLDATSDKED